MHCKDLQVCTSVWWGEAYGISSRFIEFKEYMNEIFNTEHAGLIKRNMAFEPLDHSQFYDIALCCSH